MVVKYTSKMQVGQAQAKGAVAGEISGYMDETGKTRLDRSNAYYMPQPDRVEFRARQLAGDQPEQPKVKVVVPRGYERGEIHAEGFLAARLLAESIPTKPPLGGAARKQWASDLAEVWTRQLPSPGSGGGRADVALKMVFSPSAEDNRAIEASSCSPITVLRRYMRKAFSGYEKIHGLEPGSVGYVWGIHLDKEVLHAHCVIFPYTRDGKRLKLSNRLKEGGKRRDFLTEFVVAARQQYDDEKALAISQRPRASLVQQLTRSIGARMVTGEARTRDQAALRTEVSTMAASELSRDADTPLSPAAVRPILERWVSQAARKVAARDTGTVGKEPDPARVADAENNWWRYLWISLEWRKRKAAGPETTWPGFSAMAGAVAAGTRTGPEEPKLPAILRRTASDLRPEVPLEPQPGEPGWAGVAKLRVNEWLNQTREIFVRALVVDTLSARSARDPMLKMWFGSETLRYDAPAAPQAPASQATPDQPADIDAPLRFRAPPALPELIRGR